MSLIELSWTARKVKKTYTLRYNFLKIRCWKIDLRLQGNAKERHVVATKIWVATLSFSAADLLPMILNHWWAYSSILSKPSMPDLITWCRQCSSYPEAFILAEHLGKRSSLIDHGNSGLHHQLKKLNVQVCVLNFGSLGPKSLGPSDQWRWWNQNVTHSLSEYQGHLLSWPGQLMRGRCTTWSTQL